MTETLAKELINLSVDERRLVTDFFPGILRFKRPVTFSTIIDHSIKQPKRDVSFSGLMNKSREDSRARTSLGDVCQYDNRRLRKC